MNASPCFRRHFLLHSILARTAAGLLALVVAATAPAAETDLPATPREFRAAWVATVANIDWPSKPGLSTADQQRELVELLDCAVRLNLNAIILQVRPAADALYASKLEPWSEYLTGVQGQAPAPFYDPLEFAVAKAHDRGLELHAWFNPYRVRHSDAKGEVAANHASRTMADAVRTYGKFQWFDPGEPAAIERFLAVVTDVVRRYDVDGVHIDDYFYPYPINGADGKPASFPDDASYARAVAQGVKFSRDDWRRENVNQLVERMYAEVHAIRPEVKVGISPFGIWRPGHPKGIQGFDQYASLYADARKWIRQGWVDYLTPQLYWPVAQKAQSYPKLLAWWSLQNVKRRGLWPGNFTSKIRSNENVVPDAQHWEAAELVRQIEATRAQRGAGGNVHFSMKALVKNYDGIADKLRTGLYREPALVPIVESIPGDAPPQPKASARSSADGAQITLQPSDDKSPWLWVVHVRRDGSWHFAIVPGDLREYTAPAGVSEAAITAVSRTGRASRPARVLVSIQ